MRTTGQLINNGKITIPVTIRRELGLQDGDVIEVEITDVYSDRGED